jgi:hypothetical protein
MSGLMFLLNSEGNVCINNYDGGGAILFRTYIMHLWNDIVLKNKENHKRIFQLAMLNLFKHVFVAEHMRVLCLNVIDEFCNIIDKITRKSIKAINKGGGADCGFAITSIRDDYSISCSNDGCKNKGTKKCGGCLMQFYCGADCMRNDWKNHKPLCKNSKC